MFMCKNKLTSSIPMHELPTPSMHRRSKGGQGKRTQTSHRMSHHQETCKELSPAVQTAPRNAMTLKDRRAGDPPRG